MTPRRVFPLKEKRTAFSPPAVVVWLVGLLALGPLPSATAQQTANRFLVPEPIAVPQDEPADDPPADDPDPADSGPVSAASRQEEEATVPDPEPRRERESGQPAAAAPPEEEPPDSDPEPPQDCKRLPAVSPQEDEAPLERPGPARRRQPRAMPACSDADDDCVACPGCAAPCWGPGPWWRSMPDRLEARGEWMFCWGKGNYVPALLSTGPATLTQDQAGAFGAAGTVILFGASDQNVAASNGVRITADYWLTSDHTVAVEGEYFGLGDNTAGFQTSSGAYPVLARPFFDAQLGTSQVHSIAYPGEQSGLVGISATTGFQAAGILLRQTWFRRSDAHLDFLLGYRYLRLSDDLSIDEHDTFINPAGVVPQGSTLQVFDRFGTLNEFQGADLGFSSEWDYKRCHAEVVMKVGLGNTCSRVSIGGNNIGTEPNQAPVVSEGGFLAQPSNSGQYVHNQFTMVPEVGITLGFDLTRRVQLLAGYSLLYWSAVARTGDQIDLNLTYPTVPGTPAPEFRFAMTNYWMQGLNLGLDCRF